VAQKRRREVAADGLTIDTTRSEKARSSHDGRAFSFLAGRYETI
jgi:hypothetical protein